jgi:hypothetical protein
MMALVLWIWSLRAWRSCVWLRIHKFWIFCHRKCTSKLPSGAPYRLFRFRGWKFQFTLASCSCNLGFRFPLRFFLMPSPVSFWIQFERFKAIGSLLQLGEKMILLSRIESFRFSNLSKWNSQKHALFWGRLERYRIWRGENWIIVRLGGCRLFPPLRPVWWSVWGEYQHRFTIW